MESTHWASIVSFGALIRNHPCLYRQTGPDASGPDTLGFCFHSINVTAGRLATLLLFLLLCCRLPLPATIGYWGVQRSVFFWGAQRTPPPTPTSLYHIHCHFHLLITQTKLWRTKIMHWLWIQASQAPSSTLLNPPGCHCLHHWRKSNGRPLADVLIWAAVLCPEQIMKWQWCSACTWITQCRR